MSVQTNAGEVATRLNRVGIAVRAQLRQELELRGQLAAAVMRQEAPKWRSSLANSVRVQPQHAGVADLAVYVYPAADYAAWVHRGRKPGKALPRFFSPAAASIVAWLEDRIADTRRAADPRWRKARLGTKRRTAAELELRDRYMALSRAVKARGLKANPFVTRTAKQVRGPTIQALVEAVQRGVQNALNRGGAA